MNGLFCFYKKSNGNHLEDKNQILKHKVDFNKILFAETCVDKKNTIIIYTEDSKTYKHSATLKKIVEVHKSFSYVSKSKIVNLNKINKTNSRCSTLYIANTNIKIKVSRKFIKEITEKIRNDYLL